MAAVTTPTARLRRLDSPLAQAVAVAILIAISLVVRLAVNTRFQAPTILTDELTYAQMAENAANGDLWQGGYGLVYPLLLAPAWALADSGVEAYTWMKAINALLVSLTAIPVFLWARRMMRPAYALTAVALTLLLPAMAFSGHVMTDTPFILAVTVAAWALASALERPTIARQALALIAVAVALGTRSQAIALLPAIPLAILLLTAADARSDGFSLRGWGARLARFWPLAVVGVAGVAALAARSVANGGQWRDLFQAYAIATTGQYKAETVARYYVWHLGEAAFAVGVIPLAALLVLVGMAVLNRSRSRAERAYLATAVAVIATVALLVATFASYWSERVIERNLMCLFPLVMIGFALWLDRSLPRPPRTTGIAAAITAVVVVSVPFAFLYQRSPSTESWAVVLPDLLTRRLPGGVDTVQILIVVGVATALLLFGFLRPRIAVVALPLLLAGYFVASQAAAVHTVGKTAAAYRNVPGLGADASWIDRLVGPDATVAFVSGSNLGTQGEQIAWWETGFFNRADLQWVVWGQDLTADPLTGAVTRPDGGEPDLPRYVLTPAAWRFAGETLEDRGGYLLQEPSRPYQLLDSVSGVYADGWTGRSVAIDVYNASTADAITLRLHRLDNPFSAPDAAVTVQVAPLVRAEDGTVTTGEAVSSEADMVANGGSLDLTLATPGEAFRVSVEIDPPFVPATYGSPDQRELGARISVVFRDTVILK